MVACDLDDSACYNNPTYVNGGTGPGDGNANQLQLEVVTTPGFKTGSDKIEMDCGNNVAAVSVKNVYKQYGKGPTVLNGLSMTVRKGLIYSLLGSSGCGKTTILSCIVGLKQVNSGEILVFGHKPGTKGSGVPGKRVGYMPQDLALYGNFSIHECLEYCGALCGMTREEIKSRRDFLTSLLNLPDASARINTLSGGQSKRVSLAQSLIHSPELLILDEPTVGVDALLRESIWNHLEHLVSTCGTTVIITTHYIEEARHSSAVGIMRGGRLIAEENPQALLQKYNTTSLEEVVLHLSKLDVNGCVKENAAEIQQSKEGNDLNLVCDTPSSGDNFYPKSIDKDNGGDGKSTLTGDDFMDAMKRVRALILKNTRMMSRNLLLLGFMILLPAAQVFIVGVALGNDPETLNFGVVNYEANGSELCTSIIAHRNLPEEGCDIDNLSCKFISKIPKDKFNLATYEDEEAARNAVENGNIWGFMTFPSGFSDNVYVRSTSLNTADNETLEGSFISVRLDLSNKLISAFLKKTLYDAYQDFLQQLLEQCGLHSDLAKSPIQYGNPIYGAETTDFTEFLCPTVLLAVVVFYPLCSTCVSFIWDKKQGTMDRARVLGVKMWEIMTAQFVTEGAVLLIQACISLFILTVAFNITILGSFTLFASLIVLLGIVGVSIGMLLGSLCDEEIEGIILSMALFFPNFLLSGMIWPLEGMPLVGQYLASILPCTLAGESIRSITTRGWGLLHKNVWPGFLIAVGWVSFLWFLTVWFHKRVLKLK